MRVVRESERELERGGPIWMGFDDGRRIRSALKVGKLKFSVSKDGGGGRGRRGLCPSQCPAQGHADVNFGEERDKFMQLRPGKDAGRSSGAGCSKEQAKADQYY